MKKLGFLFLAVVATLGFSFGVSWLSRLASKPSDLELAIGVGGMVSSAFIYWEVLKLCVRGFRGMKPATIDP